MRDILLMALTFSLTMTIGVLTNTDDSPSLVKHKLYKCNSLKGNTLVIEGERKRYIGECSFGGYFVHGPTIKI